MKSVAMEENKQEKELEELQRLQDGFAVKVNATLNNYLNLPVDKMNKKCDTLQHELEKIHEMQMNIFTRFRKNQLANEVQHMFTFHCHNFWCLPHYQMRINCDIYMCCLLPKNRINICQGYQK